MIILADIPFFDAFTYAKKMTSDGVIDFWSSGEPLPMPTTDIFAEEPSSSVCFVSGIENASSTEGLLHINSVFKVVVIWNSNFDMLRKFVTINSIEHKFVSIPKYIDLKSSVSQSSGLNKDVMKSVIEDLSTLPLSDRLTRESVSSIVHKISVVYSDSGTCHVGDIVLGVSPSVLDLTSAFCRGENEFVQFCYFYFSNKKNTIHPQLYHWIYFMNRFLISSGDSTHSIHKAHFNMSGKLSDMINQKLSGLINQDNIMFCSLCWTHVMIIDNFEESILAIASMRSAVSGRITKKDSMNIIRNIYA